MPSESFKTEFAEVDEALIHCVERPCLLIICIL
jgi:hypothetical protein